MRLELRTALLPAAAVPAMAAAAVAVLAALGCLGGVRPAAAQVDAAMPPLPALLGPYDSSREASSGTGWQPESTPVPGQYESHGDWQTLLRSQVFLVYDDQEGPRGSLKWFSENWAADTATRQLGPGRLGLRAMVSLEPWTIGRDGYPLLLQTGQTANGRTPLVDRQEPQDLLDELSATYSLEVGRGRSIFAYLGLPGEPALGPPSYKVRFSSLDNPEAPLSHQWLDATDTTYGVATLGAVLGTLKVEGSAFNGHEPDQVHTNIDSPTLDSYAFRVSLEPDPGLAVQASFGHLRHPEEVAPLADEVRSTVSIMYNSPIAFAGNLQTTLAWGRNQRRPGRTTNAYLWEGEASFLTRHNMFYRIEALEDDELVPEVLLGGHLGTPFPIFGKPPLDSVAVISKLGGGYVYDFLLGESYRTGAGFDVSVLHVPSRLEANYGGEWVPGWMLFLRFRLGRPQ